MSQPKTSPLTVSVVRYAAERDIIHAADLAQVIDDALDLANCLRSPCPAGDDWELSQVIIVGLDVKGVEEALGRLLSAAVVQGCRMYSPMTEERYLAPPDLKVTGVPARAAGRLCLALLRLADSIVAVTRLPGITVEAMPEGPGAGVTVKFYPRLKPLAPAELVARLEHDAHEVKRLLRLAEEQGRERPAAVTETQSPADDQAGLARLMERVAQAVGDDNAVRVLAIANSEDWPGDRKMHEILRLDRRFADKTSAEWGKLLGVTPAAVRGYSTWKRLHKSKKTDN